jgi:hypothetical protein
LCCGPAAGEETGKVYCLQVEPYAIRDRPKTAMSLPIPDDGLCTFNTFYSVVLSLRFFLHNVSLCNLSNFPVVNKEFAYFRGKSLFVESLKIIPEFIEDLRIFLGEKNEAYFSIIYALAICAYS